ncbi:MAG: hypothetical protein HEQ22_10955 [Sphingopyxis sp.]|uniref:hypothetical protein n=1 Tax=Sphingopyxis sp. TaxID=1908224 RepID=UPI003D81200C
MEMTTNLLPPELDAALQRLGVKLEAGDRLDAEARDVVKQMADLPPAAVVGLDSQIAVSAKLWHRPNGNRVLAKFWGDVTDAEQLLRTPLLEYIFLFHHDGRLRESALQRAVGGIPSAFLFAAICWRLNDWAAPVRKAAAKCAERCFPATDPAVVAAALSDLMQRKDSWSRWEEERQLFEDQMSRPAVARSLVAIIAERPTGAMAKLLRSASKTPHLDRYLDEVFRSAVQPAVRAAALRMLLQGGAVWPVGRGWQWIDKSMGLRRWVMIFDRRTIDVETAPEDLVGRGIDDKSAMVRGVALSGAIRHLRGTTIERVYADKLKHDRSRSVRERARFILDHPV